MPHRVTEKFLGFRVECVGQPQQAYQPTSVICDVLWLSRLSFLRNQKPLNVQKLFGLSAYPMSDDNPSRYKLSQPSGVCALYCDHTEITIRVIDQRLIGDDLTSNELNAALLVKAPDQ